MKNIPILIFAIIFIFSCGDSRTTLQKATDLRCECLAEFDKEKNNLMDVLACIDKLNNSKEFADLDPKELAKEMELKCAEYALPLDELESEEN